MLLVRRAALLAGLALPLAACGGSGPTLPSAAAPLDVSVLPDAGADTAALHEAVDYLAPAVGGGLLKMEWGRGRRQITVRMGTPHSGDADAQPSACPCTGEGSIVIGNPQVAQTPAALLHEMGHLFGLNHSTDPNDLMYPVMDYGRDAGKRFSEAELAHIRAAILADSDAAATR